MFRKIHLSVRMPLGRYNKNAGTFCEGYLMYIEQFGQEDAFAWYQWIQNEEH